MTTSMDPCTAKAAALAASRSCSITCGNCHGTHKSVQAIRLCYETVNAIWQLPCSFGHLFCWYHETVETMDEAVACGDQLQAQQEAELHAEYLVERFFEERGAWEPPEWSYTPQGF